MRVGQLLTKISIEIVRFRVAVDQARLFCHEQSALLQAHKAAVCAFGHGGSSDLHLTVFGNVTQQRWHVEHFLICHICFSFFLFYIIN